MRFLSHSEIDYDIKLKSDEEVLALSVGRPNLFKEIVSRYEEKFLAKAKSIIGNKDDADDIVQDTFTKIYLNAGRFRKVEGASFSSWAYKILFNTSLTYYSKLKKERELVVKTENDVLENLATYEDDHDRVALEGEIIFVLSQMPRHLARILRLYFLEGRPQKEISHSEKISLAAVKTRMHRAKKEFRKALSGKDSHLFGLIGYDSRNNEKQRA